MASESSFSGMVPCPSSVCNTVDAATRGEGHAILIKPVPDERKGLLFCARYHLRISTAP